MNMQAADTWPTAKGSVRERFSGLRYRRVYGLFGKRRVSRDWRPKSPLIIEGMLRAVCSIVPSGV
jgi:hypothetical protein